jgi:hypothetical protein
MNEIAPFLPPALALFIIIRRGLKPRRIKPDRLWTFPAIITLLALATIWRGKVPGAEALAIFAAAMAAGAVLGWFTAQHVELTLDPKTQTIMSKPTPFGTAITAAVFAVRALADYWHGGHGGLSSMLPATIVHSELFLWLTDASLLFVAARGMTRAWHMWVRTRPLLAPQPATAPPE